MDGTPGGAFPAPRVSGCRSRTSRMLFSLVQDACDGARGRETTSHQLSGMQGRPVNRGQERPANVRGAGSLEGAPRTPGTSESAPGRRSPASSPPRRGGTRWSSYGSRCIPSPPFLARPGAMLLFIIQNTTASLRPSDQRSNPWPKDCARDRTLAPSTVPLAQVLQHRRPRAT